MSPVRAHLAHLPTAGARDPRAEGLNVSAEWVGQMLVSLGSDGSSVIAGIRRPELEDPHAHHVSYVVYYRATQIVRHGQSTIVSSHAQVSIASRIIASSAVGWGSVVTCFMCIIRRRKHGPYRVASRAVQLWGGGHQIGAKVVQSSW